MAKTTIRVDEVISEYLDKRIKEHGKSKSKILNELIKTGIANVNQVIPKETLLPHLIEIVKIGNHVQMNYDEQLGKDILKEVRKIYGYF